MDNHKVGALFCRLRKEKGMTQKQIADLMNISDKTISKWERGMGCPDVSLLSKLSDIFEVNIEKLLNGDLEPNIATSGNLKRVKFYVCPNCGNVINNTGNAKVSCCGRKLSPLKAMTADKMHAAMMEESEGEYYISFEHEMSKAHYLSFVAYATSDRILFIKLYPEQNASVRFPIMNGGRLQQKHSGDLYYYCSQHGLWVY